MACGVALAEGGDSKPPSELRSYEWSRGKSCSQSHLQSDGQAAEVTVQKGLGYSVIDEAAMEGVKLACSVHLKYALRKPFIVVSLPVVYRWES